MSRQRTSRYFQKLAGIPTLMGISSSTKKAGNFDHPSLRIRIDVLLGDCTSDLLTVAPAFGSNRRYVHTDWISSPQAKRELNCVPRLQFGPVTQILGVM